MMKTIKSIAALLLMASPLVALENCNVVGAAEALYWRAFEEGVTYAVYRTQPNPGLTFADNQQIELQPGYGWGFRVMIGIDSCCSPLSAELEWLHFSKTTSATTTQEEAAAAGFAILETIAPIQKFLFRRAAAITFTQSDRYNRVSVRGYWNFCSSCWGDLNAYLGGGWREIFVDHRYRYVQSFVNAINSTLDVSLGALSLGLAGRSHLFCGFGARMRLGGFVGIGDISHKIKGIGNNWSGFDTTISPKGTHCLVGLEADGAISFAQTIGCVCIEGRIGYRFDYYFGLETRDAFTNEKGPTNTASRGYGGPYIGASLSY